MTLPSPPVDPTGKPADDAPRLTYVVQPTADGVTVVTLAGELDHGSHHRLLAEVAELIERGRSRLEFDLSALEFCDSTGLGALVRLHRQAQNRGGWLRVVRPSGELRRMLRTTNLDRLLGGSDPAHGGEPPPAP